MLPSNELNKQLTVALLNFMLNSEYEDFDEFEHKHLTPSQFLELTLASQR